LNKRKGKRGNTHWKHTNAIYGEIEMLKVALHLLVRKKEDMIIPPLSGKAHLNAIKEQQHYYNEHKDKKTKKQLLTYDYVTKVQPAGFVVERVNFYTLDIGNITRQELLRSAFLPLGSEALDTNYTVRSFQVTLSKNGCHGIIEGDLIRDGGYGAGATGIKKLGKAIVEFPTTITLLIRLAHFLQKEIRDAEREESIEKMSIVDSAMTQLAVHVEIMFYELGD
jgi:hypothetical protein